MPKATKPRQAKIQPPRVCLLPAASLFALLSTMALVRDCLVSRPIFHSEDAPALPFCRGSPPPRKRKATMSLDNTYPIAAGKSSSAEDAATSASAADKSSSSEDMAISASAADKSSSAEDTSTSASAADKSSSVEGTPIDPLGIRISDAIDQRLMQLASSKTPMKEHFAIEKEKGAANEKGNTPLSAAESAKALSTVGKAKSSRTSPLGPWGDRDDEEETKSSEGPNLVGKPSPLPVLNAESSHPLNRSLMSSSSPEKGTGIFPVSNCHDFKSPSSSPKRIGETSGGSSPCSGSTTIRSGGIPENNEQWTAQLAKNLASDVRRSKSPPGTLQSRELEEERAHEELNQVGEPSSRIPLDLRLTEEELRRRAAVRPAIPNVDDDLLSDAEAKAAAALFNANLGTQESSTAAKPQVNRGIIDMTDDANEGESLRPN